MMKSKKRKDKKKSKKKNKNDNDDVQEYTSGLTQGNTSEMGNTTQGMLNETSDPLKANGKKKKDNRQNNKFFNKSEKNNEDVVPSPRGATSEVTQ